MLDGLTGLDDGMDRDAEGRIWLAMCAERTRLLTWVHEHAWVTRTGVAETVANHLTRSEAALPGRGQRQHEREGPCLAEAREMPPERSGRVPPKPA